MQYHDIEYISLGISSALAYIFFLFHLRDWFDILSYKVWWCVCVFRMIFGAARLSWNKGTRDIPGRCLSVWVCVCVCVCVSVWVCVSVCAISCVYFFVSLCVAVYIFLSVCLWVWLCLSMWEYLDGEWGFLCVWECGCLVWLGGWFQVGVSVYVFVCDWFCLFVFAWVCLCMWLCGCVSLSVSLCVWEGLSACVCVILSVWVGGRVFVWEPSRVCQRWLSWINKPKTVNSHPLIPIQSFQEEKKTKMN